MKTIIRFTMFLLAAGIAGSLLNAREPSLAAPKDGPDNFTASIGFTTLRASFGGKLLGTTPADGSTTLRGGTLALGWRPHRRHGIQLDADYLRGTNEGERLVAAPLLLSYNFYIPWAEANDAVELRISPTGGALHLNSDYDGENSHDTLFAYGLGIGLTFHIDSQYYIDIAYRYLRTIKAKLYDEDIHDADTHSLTISAGIKF